MNEKYEFADVIKTIFKPTGFWKIVAMLLPVAYVLIVLLTTSVFWDLPGLTYFLSSTLVFLYYQPILNIEQMREFFEIYGPTANIIGIAVYVMNVCGVYLMITALGHYHIKIARLKNPVAPQTSQRTRNGLH